jgi:hypothetical protein
MLDDDQPAAVFSLLLLAARGASGAGFSWLLRG